MVERRPSVHKQIAVVSAKQISAQQRGALFIGAQMTEETDGYFQAAGFFHYATTQE
jgi:hypothetical protein